MDIRPFNVGTTGPESECKCLFACENNDTLSVLLFCTELIFIRDIRLFVCLFFFTSPKLDGVRVTNTGTMLLCLKYIRWHEQRRILHIPYSQFEIERKKSRNYIDNQIHMYKEEKILKTDYLDLTLNCFACFPTYSSSPDTIYSISVKWCDSNVFMLLCSVLTELLSWKTG